MMLYALPPAGDPVTLRRSPAVDPERLCAPYRLHYYGSGTVALAAAVLAAVRLKPCRRPEVLLPAYACPDLISAVLHAGARPVLVDFIKDRPWLSLTQVRAALSDRTVAIVGVHLFGIPERVEQLVCLARSAGALLIEDSAQRLPDRPGQAGVGDFIVFSFGRGKPVSLLGGGLTLAANSELARALPSPPAERVLALSVRLKLGLYNGLRRPHCYWLPQAMPGLGLGQTRFKPLRGLVGMDRTRRALLPANLAQYRRHPNRAQCQWQAALASLDGRRLRRLPVLCAVSRQDRLLRYPLLFAGQELRDAAYRALAAAGLGPARMYRVSLPHIAGVAKQLQRYGDYPQAERFAARILTLPTHRGVSPDHIQCAAEILQRLLALERPDESASPSGRAATDAWEG